MPREHLPSALLAIASLYNENDRTGVRCTVIDPIRHFILILSIYICDREPNATFVDLDFVKEGGIGYACGVVENNQATAIYSFSRDDGRRDFGFFSQNLERN